MASRQSLVASIAVSTLVPATAVAQSDPGVPIAEPGIAEIAVLGLLVYAAYVVFTVVVGVLVLAVSEFALSGSYVRAIERRIYDRPVRSGLVGFGAIVAGFVGILLLMIVLLLLVEIGVPEPLGLVAAIPFFGGVLFLYVGATIGTIVLGSYVLRRLSGESNLWLALVVGALVVNAPVLNFVLAFLVLFLGTGAMIGRWWSVRRDEPSGPNPREPVEG